MRNDDPLKLVLALEVHDRAPLAHRRTWSTSTASTARGAPSLIVARPIVLALATSACASFGVSNASFEARTADDTDTASITSRTSARARLMVATATRTSYDACPRS